MIHKSRPMLSVTELRSLIASIRENNTSSS
jgi:hypothetical protein